MQTNLRNRAVSLAIMTGASMIAGALTAAPASTQESIVSLRTPDRHIDFGRSVVLTGRVSDPLAEGQQVEIFDASDKLVGAAVADDTGKFRTRLWPRKRMQLHARWQDHLSDVLTVNVRPLVDVELGSVRLFDRARISGEVRPVLDGQRANLTLSRDGKKLASRSIVLSRSPRFEASFPIRNFGRYRVALQIDGAEHLAARVRSDASVPQVRALSVGSRGRLVKQLERRLIQLGYYLPRADRVYDHKTWDAMLAFNKIQRRSRTGSVGESTWRALADPVRPQPRVKRGYHIEVDQTRQALFVVGGGRVRWILHTSTGAGSATRDGSYVVHRKLAGTSGNGLYYPSYFDGLRAIHGWPEVPTYNASHGCARVPMWSAQWIYSMTTIGTRVIVYH